MTRMTQVLTDRERFEKLLDAETRRALFNFCYRTTGRRIHAEDLVAETLARGWAKFHTYDTSRKLSSWLIKIAHRLWLDELRFRTHRPQVVTLETPEGERAYEATPSETFDPHEALWASQSRERMEALIMLASPCAQEALRLTYVLGLKRSEVADTLGIGYGALHSRLFAAQRRIRKALETQGDERG